MPPLAVCNRSWMSRHPRWWPLQVCNIQRSETGLRRRTKLFISPQTRWTVQSSQRPFLPTPSIISIPYIYIYFDFCVWTTWELNQESWGEHSWTERSISPLRDSERNEPKTSEGQSTGPGYYQWKHGLIVTLVAYGSICNRLGDTTTWKLYKMDVCRPTRIRGV